MPEPSNLSKMQDMKRRIRERHHHKHPVGAVPTLGELQRGASWVWMYCEQRQCLHRAPMAVAPAAILWGLNASSNVLRERARCTCCGHLGDAALKLPSWGGLAQGFESFPVVVSDG